jgi:hypothetical protein
MIAFALVLCAQRRKQNSAYGRSFAFFIDGLIAQRRVRNFPPQNNLHLKPT